MFKKKSNNSEEIKENKPRHEESKKPKKRARFFRLKLTLAIILALLSFSIIGVTVAALNVTSSETNLPNIYVNGIFVGGMTEEQTLKTLEDAGWKESTDAPMVVKLPAGVSFQLDVVKSGAMFSLEDAASLAYRYGHSSGVYGNLWKYLRNRVEPVDVSEVYGGLNEEYILQETEKAVKLFMEKTADKGYELDLENSVLRLMKGAGQMQIDAANLSSQLGHAMMQGEREFVKDRHDNNLSAPDFNKLHEEIYVEAQDAHYLDTFEVVDEVKGLDFDVSEAEEIWKNAAAAEYYEIPLSVIEPEVSGEELRSRLFRDRLGSQTTLYTYSSDNRISNIRLCASKFDGMILYPGETFSFNEAVGKRTREAGFLEAGAYSDGQVVQEVGGGICQVSSTLYCAAMYAQMKTVYRESHYFKVDYLPLGYDATVSWSKPDYKFRNDREYPVRLAAWCDEYGKSLTVEIWGTDVDGSYVELTRWEAPVYDEEYTEVQIGTAAIAYRNIYDKDGNFLYRVEEPYSMYHLHEDEIQWPEEVLEEEQGILDGILGALEEEENSSTNGSAIIIS